MRPENKLLFGGLVLLAAATFAGCNIPAGAFIFPGGVAVPSLGTTFALTINNTSGGSISNSPVTFAQPFATSDLPVGSKAVVYSGSTPLTTQMDGSSSWKQDGSGKNDTLSIVPASLSSGINNFTVKIVAGALPTTPNVSKANITGNTNFCLKSTDLTEAGGTAETGTWDLICLNTVLNTYNQYNNSTGYGANPVGGWEYYASGPNRVGIHAFQYPIRESDGAIQKWLRTDMWIDFWGSGSTPCPCSVRFRVTEPNTFAGISGGTVGPSTEPSYVYTAIAYDGANVLYNWGGAGDPRTVNLTSTNFNASTDKVTLAGGNPYETTQGIYPVRLTCSGACPGGLTTGQIYWVNFDFTVNPDTSQFWQYQCNVTGGEGDCTTTPINLTSTGSGTITLTPYVPTNTGGGMALVDNVGERIWVSAAGTVTAAPTTLVGHDFNYLTQKTKATPPYITALAGNLGPYSVINCQLGCAHMNYYPGSFDWPYDINTTGDGPGDERIGAMNHTTVYALFMPNDVNAAISSKVMAASWERANMYQYDETVGLPIIYNNGHVKNGVTYPTFGAVQATQRPYPYQTGSWLTPSNTGADESPTYDRYGARMDGSHQPRPQIEAFLRTGEPEYLDSLVQQANANIGAFFQTSSPVGGNTYYRVYGANAAGNTRGAGWGMMAWDQADFFIPDNAPISQYLHDVETDNANWWYDFHSQSANNKLAALGYYWGDVVISNFNQWWQDDFLYLQNAMQAWRGEYPGYATWINNWFEKQVIGRFDSAVGGCLWLAPVRYNYPYSTNTYVSFNNLEQTWSAFQTNTNYWGTDYADVTASITGPVMTVTAVSFGVVTNGNTIYRASQASTGLTITSFGTGTGGTGTYNLSGSATIASEGMSGHGLANGYQLPPWTSCPTSGFITDGVPPFFGSVSKSPVSLFSTAAVSLAMAATVGHYTGASALYTAYKTQQYTDGLTYINYTDSSGTHSYAEFAIGPLGATN